MCREALELCPPPHPDRSTSLNNLGNALWSRHQQTRIIADIDEATSLYREALKLRPSPHPHRAYSLRSLAMSLDDMCKVCPTLPFIQEAIPLCEELLASHYPVGNKYRLETVNRLASLLQKRSNATQPTEDDAYIAKLQEEARQLSHPHLRLSRTRVEGLVVRPG
jgi:hypothetical protein